MTNEIAATATAAACVYMCLRMLRGRDAGVGQHAVMGLLLGAALLTKTTILVALPAFAAALAWNLRDKKKSIGNSLGCLGVTALACAVVAGWHYGRVTAHFGRPFVGDWDVESGFAWWQTPGYRTLSFYTGFGSTFTHPFYNSLVSFADGHYSTLWGDSGCGGVIDLGARPPWNYDLMTAGYWLALGPTAGIGLGLALAVAGFVKQPRADLLLVLGVAGLIGLFVLYFSLQIPVQAVVKAFYGMAAFVPLCVFGAWGLETLARRAGRLAFVIEAAVLVWGLNAGAAYWIRSNAPETRLLAAGVLSRQGKHDQAVNRLEEVLRENPGGARAGRELAMEYLALGRPELGRTQVAAVLARDPGDGLAHLILAAIAGTEGRVDEAMSEAARGRDLAPDYPTGSQNLAHWLEQAGRRPEAMVAEREALRIDPQSPEVHFHLARALADSGNLTDAAVHFQMAATLSPRSPDAHDGLGQSLLALGRADKAERQFAAAARLSPGDTAIRGHWVDALRRQGKAAEAIAEARHILEQTPNDYATLNTLAWMLATAAEAGARNGEEAVRLAQRAYDAGGQDDAECLSILAAAYAEAGRFTEAIGAGTRAVEVALNAGDAALAETNHQRLELYRAGQPYHEPTRPPGPEK